MEVEEGSFATSEADGSSCTARNVLRFVTEEKWLRKRHSADNCQSGAVAGTVCLLRYLFLSFESQVSVLVFHFLTVNSVFCNKTLFPHIVWTSPSLKPVSGFLSSYFELWKEGMLRAKLNDIIKFHPKTLHAGTEGEHRGIALLIL
jgi:hypothetical protein